MTKAIQWAQKTGNIRVNEVHGEQEICLILNETFVHKELREEETTREGSIAVEDWVQTRHVLLHNSSFHSFMLVPHNGWFITHRIHVCYIYGNIYHQYTPNVSIPYMDPMGNDQSY